MGKFYFTFCSKLVPLEDEGAEAGDFSHKY